MPCIAVKSYSGKWVHLSKSLKGPGESATDAATISSGRQKQNRNNTADALTCMYREEGLEEMPTGPHYLELLFFKNKIKFYTSNLINSNSLIRSSRYSN